MKPVARFAVREGDGKLILGVNLVGHGSPLKPGVVYQVEDVLGELVIREIGPCAIGPTINTPDKSHDSCWGHKAGMIIAYGYHLMTEGEYHWLCEDSTRQHLETREAKP